MYFSSAAVTFIALASAGTTLGAPTSLEQRGSQVVIGYRTASKAEAAAINKAKTIVYDSSKSSGGKQNGAGVYLTSVLGQWPQSHIDDEFCVISADSDKLAAANKAWIPTDVEWNESAVEKAIKTLDPKWSADSVMRLSIVKGKKFLQLIIPKGMVGVNAIVAHTSGTLSFKAVCKPESQWTAADKVKVDFTSGPFAENIKGTPQHEG